ncbi:MAG: hypothetical protein ACOCQG_06055 [Candidatus Nanoarchaeia archaeon]
MLYFLGFIFQLPAQDVGLFIKELYFAFFLLIVAAIGLYTIAAQVKAAWLYFLVFFAIGALNAVYVYLETAKNETLATSIVIVAVVGILYSLSQYRKKEPKKARKREELAPIIVENIDEKPAEKKTAKKRTTKKTTKKKTAKKSTAKKSAAKKTAKKKTAKKSTAKKSAAKKTTKKKTAAKKTTKKKTAKKSTAKKSVPKKTTKASSTATKKKSAKRSSKKSTSARKKTTKR